MIKVILYAAVISLSYRGLFSTGLTTEAAGRMLAGRQAGRHHNDPPRTVLVLLCLLLAAWALL